MNVQRSRRETAMAYGIYKRKVYLNKKRRQNELRRRCSLFMIAMCLAAVCTISYHAISSRASTGEEQVSFKYYTNITVRYGESLWDIADSYIDYEQYKDKKAYIAEVMSINHLEDEDMVKAGQYLIVPYYSTEFLK